jgi:hypothetical protein
LLEEITPPTTLPPMRATPEREPLFQDVMARIGELSPQEGSDVLLHYFLGVLTGVDAAEARRLRDEISTRFGGRHCSQELCTLMLEILNGHPVLCGRAQAA